MRLLLAILLLMSCTSVYAHEMTPTYPKMSPSHIDGVYKTTMKMFNKRSDVEYYEVGVFDKDFNNIPFVTSYNIIQLGYLGHVTFDVYIRNIDLGKAVYICSKSKLKKDSNTRAVISSKICSKIK
jgi:hypothetical protein